MARFGGPREESGELEVRVSSTGDLEGYFVTKIDHREMLQPDSPFEALLLRLTHDDKILKIFPVNTRIGKANFLEQKYSKIGTLSLHIDSDSADESPDLLDLIETLPPGFSTDFQYGLGFLKDLNRLIRIVEESTNCDEIRISNVDKMVISGSIFEMSLSSFRLIWNEMQRINSRANNGAGRVKDTFVSNSLASVIGLETKEYSLGRHPLSKLLTKESAGISTLTPAEQQSLTELMPTVAAQLAEASPEKFVQLRNDIELVNLDQLIEKFEIALKQGRNEDFWQEFFVNNSFALQQIFGSPMIQVAERASVGGVSISGSGNKIADFLLKNSITNNVALVEIKTPTTPLVSRSPYRKGVYGVSSELNGALAQVLDQEHKLKSSFAALKQESRIWDIEDWAVGCFVIAGTAPDGQEIDKQKSFELFRSNSNRVRIVTFDEVHGQLKILRELLSQN